MLGEKVKNKSNFGCCMYDDD